MAAGSFILQVLMPDVLCDMDDGFAFSRLFTTAISSASEEPPLRAFSRSGVSFKADVKLVMLLRRFVERGVLLVQFMGSNGEVFVVVVSELDVDAEVVVVEVRRA